LSEAYHKLCKGVRLTFKIGDISENMAHLILDTAQKCEGKTPLIVSIFSNDQDISANFSNHELKVDAKKFLEMFPSTLPCKIKLE
jgi:hypothetical protein